LLPPLLLPLLLLAAPLCGGLLPGLLGKSRSDRRDTAGACDQLEVPRLCVGVVRMRDLFGVSGADDTAWRETKGEQIETRFKMLKLFHLFSI
jgi:hypothetical protein